MSNTSEQSIFVRNLIDAVREHRCLYDKKDTSYFNRREKEKAWNIIGQQLGRSDVACHRRWKLLREKFAKELKKRDRMLKNGENFQSDWTCFQNIMYIEDHIAPRKKTDKAPFVLTKNLSSKRMVYENSMNADTVAEKRPYCPTGLNFLAQLSKATLQASQLSDSQNSNFSDPNLRSETTKLETDESQIDESTDLDSPISLKSESSECSVPSISETPTVPPSLHSTKNVDELLKELRTNKETSLNFVKNLTNALKINNFNIFKKEHQMVYKQQQQQQSPLLNASKISDIDTTQKSRNVSDAVSMLKDTPTKDEVVRNTLLRVNGMNDLVNNLPNENLSTEVTSSGNLTTIDSKDELFGKMVVSMLGDITDEEYKDDAKFGIMQVLINAKRACKNKPFNEQ